MIVNGLIQNTNIFDKIGSINNTINNNKTTDINSDNGGLSFVDTLKEKLDEVNTQQLEADKVTEAFIKGEDVDIHQVMISTEEAKQSLQMAVQVRNKLVEAFQEINRMQL